MNLLHSIKAHKNDSIINVIIEVPSGSKNKIEYDLDQEKFVIDRVLKSNLTFPFNYGFVPETWSKDNDPLDAVVLSSKIMETGNLIETRVIGLLATTDQDGNDSKLITVPVNEKDSVFSNLSDINTLDKITLQKIEYFYKNYKINEPKKWVDIDGFLSQEEANHKLAEAIENYHQHFQK